MNRKERRVAAKRNKVVAFATGAGQAIIASVADLMASARQYYQRGQYTQADNICHQILARDPAHVDGLNLLGLSAQGAGLHKRAVNFFAKALAADELNPACHYNIAASYQALGRRYEAAAHFDRAIYLGLSNKHIEHFIAQNTAVSSSIARVTNHWPLLSPNKEILGDSSLEAFGDDIFLQCALASTILRGAGLEAVLTQARVALLTAALEDRGVDSTDKKLGFFCALAQQCFMNEYVFSLSDEQQRLSSLLRTRLLEEVAAGLEVSSILVAAVAAYFPLHALPVVEALLAREWPKALGRLIRQQIEEPLEEKKERTTISALTAIESGTSMDVMNQYEENPYPRWTVKPSAISEEEHYRQASVRDGQRPAMEILIAGCGTGRHAILTAYSFPEAHILAVDLSLPSLAYAQRKTRQEGVHTIAYAQADILELGKIGRTFDRIEAIGVLHHLADPKAGWQVLLSLLRPNGEMAVGLYSETARRTIVEARAFIAERGYQPTHDDIRTFRQEVFRLADSRGWHNLTMTGDFYSMSGCRDLLFNVMEHRFTIPQIETLLTELDLTFVRFEPEPAVLEKFQRRFPGDAALANLADWAKFEAENPDAFWNMYNFIVRKN